MKKAAALIGSLCTVLLFGLVGGVKAENGIPVSVSVEPFSAEVTVEPGENYALELNLQNTDDEPISAEIELKEFSLEPDGSVNVEAPSAVDSPVEWLSLSETEFTLDVEEEKTLDLGIDVPEDVAPRGNYVAVVYTFSPTEEAADETAIKAISQLQSLIAIKTGEGITASGEVETEAVKGDGGEVDLTTSISNSGDVHFNPVVTVRVKNMFGAVTEEFTSTGENLKVLPGGVREWGNDFCLTYGFGKYTVETEAVLGSGGKVATHETSFTYFSPVLLGIIGLLVLFSLGMLIVVKKKKKVEPNGMMAKRKEQKE